MKEVKRHLHEDLEKIHWLNHTKDLHHLHCQDQAVQEVYIFFLLILFCFLLKMAFLK